MGVARCQGSAQNESDLWCPGLGWMWILPAGRNLLIKSPYKLTTRVPKWRPSACARVQDTTSRTQNTRDPATLEIQENPWPEPFLGPAGTPARGLSQRKVPKTHHQRLKKILQKVTKAMPFPIKWRTWKKPAGRNNDENAWSQLEHPIRRSKQRQQRVNQWQ